MRQKLELTFFIFLILGFLANTVLLFILNFALLLLFSLYLLVIFSVQTLGRTGAASLMAAFTTFLGLFFISSVSTDQRIGFMIVILTLWGVMFIQYLHQDHVKKTSLIRQRKRDDQLRKNKELKKEIDFYKKRIDELDDRASQRRRLSTAARELGSLLNPAKIQEKLLEIAQSIFPDSPVLISYGQNLDPVDKFIIQKRKSVLVPGDVFKGSPLMAAPISAQGSVAAIIRVGGDVREPYNKEDLRLLENLTSLASLALDNCLLFNQVQDTALRDGLTGLQTHRAFQDQLEAAILEASRFNQPLSIILSDIDHFKSINDNYGHQAGDQILQGFSHILVRNVRDIDTVARYGGEEFILLLLQTRHDEALQIAEQIRQDLEFSQFDTGNKVVQITGSFGVATFPDDAQSAQQLIRGADQRLYKAKDAGRNQVKGKAA